MENVTISFEVPNKVGYPVETLTQVAKSSVEDFMSHHRASAVLSDVEYAELRRRTEHLRLHPESGVANDKVYELVMSRLCAAM